jgi:hypothetical protein
MDKNFIFVTSASTEALKRGREHAYKPSSRESKIMELEYRFLNDPEDIQRAAWVTARKDKGLKFTPMLFYRYLISEHSPIRRLVLSWRFRNLPKRISTHLVRHVHTQPYIGGTRSDWFPDLEDPESVDHLQDGNCDALMSLARKRLCFRSWKGTVETIATLKFRLMSDADSMYGMLGSALVPNCVYRGGCPEEAVGRGCGWWKKFSEGISAEDMQNIIIRYSLYNTQFLEEFDGQKCPDKVEH